MDLVCANSGGNNLKVFFQGPSGSFASTPLTLGRSEVTLGPSSVTSGDLDSDGDQDLVSANFTGRNLTVFAQESPGSFRRRPPFLTAMLPRSATAADLDGDGDLDLGSANSSNLAVFFQESSGSFLSSPLVLGGPSITLDPQSVIATDLDGDGRQDLVSANKGGNNLTAFLQGSAGTFGSPSLSLDGPPMGGPVFVAAADLDGDGDVDLISANGDVSNLTVFWGGR